MRIQKLIFKDFRQFRGEQSLTFSYDTAKNVTLVFGTNGAGKTTILNAIQWILYGEFSPDFEQPDRLANDGALHEARGGRILEASATIVFGHAGSTYEMKRSVDARYSNESNNLQKTMNQQVTLFVTETDGSSTRVTHPEQMIAQMFPQSLAQFYFFNGERLEKMASKGFAQLGDAIRSIMNLNQFDGAIKHLPRVKTDLLDEKAKLNGEKEIRDLGSELQDVQSLLDEKSVRLQALTGEIAETQLKIDEVQEDLRRNERSAALQIERDHCEDEMKRVRERRKDAKVDRKRIVNSKSALVFMSKLAEQTLENAEVLRVRGELPRVIKVQFIDDLLAEGSCICGTLLTEGSHEHEKVSSWRLKAGHAESEEAWIKAAAFASSVEDSQGDVVYSLREAMGRIMGFDAEEIDLHARITGIEAQLREIDLDEIRNLEVTHARLRAEHTAAVGREAVTRSEIDGLARRITEINSQIDAADENDERTKLIDRRIAVVDQALAVVSKELELRSETIRQLLESGIDSTYSNIINHEYQVSVNNDFVLTLTKQIGDFGVPAVKSTAETHGLYLSFIAQLSHLNRQLSSASDSLRNPASEQFPLVMDATFGNFDEEPTRRLISSLTHLSHQVILLVSKKQGKGIVEESVKDFCGRKVVLTLHAISATRRHEVIEVNGGNHDYVVPSDSYDYTTIKEVG
jgi:DNA sulfur modification protein DndD